MIQNNNIQTSNNIFSLFPQYTLEQANVVQKPVSKESVNSSEESTGSGRFGVMTSNNVMSVKL